MVLNGGCGMAGAEWCYMQGAYQTQTQALTATSMHIVCATVCSTPHHTNRIPLRVSPIQLSRVQVKAGWAVSTQGVELRPPVVQEVEGIARRLGSDFDGLRFSVGAIATMLPMPKEAMGQGEMWGQAPHHIPHRGSSLPTQP